MAKVSILLTSYNHAQFLRQSIESVLSQSFKDFELFIVDDGSADGSAEIIRSFEDPRIHAVFHEQNQAGPHWLRDIKPKMTGEYFAMAHCDDMWLPGKLEKQVRYLDAHPEYGACFTDVEVIDENGEPYMEEDGFYYDIFSQENRTRFEWLRRFFYEGNCLCHPSLLIRLDCYDKYGMGDESMFSLPDYCQWVRLTLHTDLYVYPEKLCRFRVRRHAGNTSGDKPDGHIRSAFEMFRLLSSYLELRDKPEDFLRVFPSARQYVREGRLCVEYAYARILLDESDKPVYNLLGLLILQNLLDNPQTCALLERDYGYTKKRFAAETGGRDVFHTMGEEHFLTSSLYWDTGGGYSQTNYIARNSYSGFTGRFEVTFSFPEGLHEVRGLRFDPDEGSFRLFDNVVLQIDGEDFAPEPQGNVQTRKDGTLFYTADPQFRLDFETPRTVRTVHITGATRKFSCVEMEQEMEGRLHEMEDRLREARRGSRQASQVFWDTGDGFSEGQCLSRPCPIDKDGQFDLSFVFPVPRTGVEKLRIDPDEGVFREYQDFSVEVNGHPYTPTLYGPTEEQNGCVRFYTADPQLLVSFHTKMNITTVRISGRTRRLTAEEVEHYAQARICAAQQQAQSTVEEMAKNLASARKEQLDARKAHQEEFQAQREQAAKEQQALQNTIATYQGEIDAMRTYLKGHRFKSSLKALLGKLWTE